MVKILHSCLNVADAEASIEFYEQFGFTKSWGFEDGDTRHRYVADDAGVEIQLADTEGETAFEQGTAWDHIAIAVENVDETVASVDHHGVVKQPGDQPAASARTAFIKDPDGHVVELIEPLE
jgi:lactoylglutathione lyase